MIDLIVPVLGRDHQILPLVENIYDTTSVHFHILFLCSPNDGKAKKACDASGERYATVTWKPGKADFALKTTAGIKMTRQPWLFFGATDIWFEDGWDLQALALATASGKRVIGTNDMANPLVQRGGHFTHPLVARSYIEEHPVWDEPGAFYSSAYDHQFTDTEAFDMAKFYGEFVHCPTSVVRHRHPFYDDTVERDSTYEKALAKGAEDRATYLRRKRERRLALRRGIAA